MACDQHVCKMLLETAQMLSTAHRVLDPDFPKIARDCDRILYKKTHINHPCNKWVRQSVHNYNWLYSYYNALGIEYNYRYNTHRKIPKIHGAFTDELRDYLYYRPDALEDQLYKHRRTKEMPLFDPIGDEPTPPPLCMPDHIAEPFKTNYSWDNTVAAYRAFYIQDKSQFARWLHDRKEPDWYTQGIKQNVITV